MKQNLVIKDEKYNLLVEQIEATITEAVHNSRWMLIEGHWTVGELIREYFTEDVTKLLQGLAVDVGISERTLWYCVQAYDKYPDINLIPEGKNISWYKLITKYLPEPKERKIDLSKNPLIEGSTLITIPRNRLSLTNFPSKYFRVDISGLDLRGITHLDISFDDLRAVESDFEEDIKKCER